MLYKESLKTLKARGIGCWQLLSLPGGVRVSVLASEKLEDDDRTFYLAQMVEAYLNLF